MEEKTILLPHSVTLDDRKKISVTGVTDVGCFDEEKIELYTSYGELIIRGENLQVVSLSLENGDVKAEGTFLSMAYTAGAKKNAGIFARLLN